MRFSLNSEGNYGAVKGDLNINIRELLKKSTNNVTVSGFVTGTTKLPKFFGVSQKENGSRSEFYSAKYSEEMLQNILTYLDQFDQTISESTIDQLSQVSFTSRHISNLAGVTLTRQAIGELKDAESYADILAVKLDTIEQRLQALKLMNTTYRKFNTDDNLSTTARLDQELSSSEKLLYDLRNSLARFGTIDRAALAGIRIPTLPQAFCTSPPTEISPRSTQIDTGNPQNGPSSPPRKWKEFILTPKFSNVTYTFWADVIHGHSRSDPGCNYGHMELRARKRGPNPDIATPELGSWKYRVDWQASVDEDLIDTTGEFRVCRKQPNQSFSTKSYSFTAANSLDARILYSNWDDTLYSYITPRVFRCGQLDDATGSRSDLSQ